MSDTDAESTLYSQVGFIVIQWGHCEQSLELLVNTLFSEFGGNALPKRKRMPRQLSEKLSFVKECAAAIPELKPLRVEIERLAGAFEALTQKRHDLVHGALSDTADIDGVYSFIRLETHPDIHEIKDFKYDLRDFPSLAKELVGLGASTTKIARQVWNARPKHQ